MLVTPNVLKTQLVLISHKSKRAHCAIFLLMIAENGQTPFSTNTSPTMLQIKPQTNVLTHFQKYTISTDGRVIYAKAKQTSGTVSRSMTNAQDMHRQVHQLKQTYILV